METSFLLAKLIGLYCIIVAVGILFNLKTYQKMISDFCQNGALVYMGGIMALFFGLLIISFHNIWAFHWSVIITLFGWLGLGKGIWLILFPTTVAQFSTLYQKNTALLKGNLLLVLVVGAILTICGFAS